MALGCTWTGYADTDLKLSEFLGSDHTVAVRFMLQYPKAYVGPMLSVKGSGTYLIGQGDHGQSGPVNLIVKLGSATEAGQVTVPGALAAGIWHHLAVVRTGGILPVDPLSPGGPSVGGTFTVYLDGQQAGSMTLPPGPGPSGTLRMGKATFDAALDGGADQFYGLLDDVAIFTAALSAADVAALAAAPHLAGTEPNLHAGYTFGWIPLPGLPAKLARPVMPFGASSLLEVSSNRDDALDAKLMLRPWTRPLHVPLNGFWRVVQGYEGTTNHQGSAAFCLDLELAENPPQSEGSPFLAAASGTVSSVKQDAVSGGAANFITVRHRDHEFGDYLHVAHNSAFVKAGDHVDQHDHLAAVGSTGTVSPHLHVNVSNIGEAGKAAGGRFVTIPAVFARYAERREQGDLWVDQGIPELGQKIAPVGPVVFYEPGIFGSEELFSGVGTSAGLVSDVSAVTLTDTSRLVTAVRSASGRLGVHVWDIEDDSSVSRKGSNFAGPVSAIAAAAVSAGRLVTAVRDDSDTLKVIVWDVDEVGHVRRRGDHGAGPVSEIAAASLTPGRCATAVRDKSGSLKIIVWDIGPDGTVTRRGDATAGAVRLVALTALNAGRLCSAVRGKGGNLEVVIWEVDGSGNVTRRADATAGPVSVVAVGTYGSAAAMTYVQDSAGQLKLILWYLESTGLVRGVDHVANGWPNKTDIIAAGGNLCAFRTEQGRIGIHTWNVTAGSGPGAGIISPRAMTLLAYSGSKANVCLLPLQPDPPAGWEIRRCAAAWRDDGGHLRIDVLHDRISTIQ